MKDITIQQIQSSINNIRLQIDRLTHRYVTTADRPHSYTEAIIPLLKQELDLLNLLKECQ